MTDDTSILVRVFRMCGKWSTRLLIYVTVFSLSVSTALVLDLQFGIQPSQVVLYVLALILVLMVAVPAGLVTFARSAFIRRHRASWRVIRGIGFRME